MWSGALARKTIWKVAAFHTGGVGPGRTAFYDAHVGFEVVGCLISRVRCEKSGPVTFEGTKQTRFDPGFFTLQCLSSKKLSEPANPLFPKQILSQRARRFPFILLK